MISVKVILTPNPYRDRNFNTVRDAVKILHNSGIDTRICLPFDVEKTFDLPRDLRFSRLDRELPDAGKILQMAKSATR